MFEIPGYNIQRLLATGGMGKVYLAQQESLDRPVAIKVLNPPARNKEEMSERFLLEGRIIASLTHHNIVCIHDFGTIEEYRYIVMELLPQGNLKGKMRQRAFPVRIALKLIQHVGSALHYGHKRKIIHRDVKPSNILFRMDSTPVLTDFGIAKMLGSDGNLTQTGHVLGTPFYVSPEQVQGKEVDGRSDIYSLGIILYEMLTGERPYYAETTMNVLFKHVDEAIPSLPQNLAPLQELINILLAKDPADRFSNAAKMIKYIRDLKGLMPLSPLLGSETAPKPGILAQQPTAQKDEDRTVIQLAPVKSTLDVEEDDRTVVYRAFSPKNTNNESKIPQTQSTENESSIPPTQNTENEPKIPQTQTTKSEPKIPQTQNTEREPEIPQPQNIKNGSKIPQIVQDSHCNEDILDKTLDVEPPDEEFRGLFAEKIIIEPPNWADEDAKKEQKIVKPPRVKAVQKTYDAQYPFLWVGVLLIFVALGGAAAYFWLLEMG